MGVIRAWGGGRSIVRKAPPMLLGRRPRIRPRLGDGRPPHGTGMSLLLGSPTFNDFVTLARAEISEVRKRRLDFKLELGCPISRPGAIGA